MLLNGNQNEKSKFIFDIITQKKTDRFSKNQLFDFYKLMKEDEEDFFESISEEESGGEEQEMANVVWALIQLEDSETVDLEKFQIFLNEDKEYQNLFNIFSQNAEKNMNKIKLKKNMNEVMDLVKKNQRDLLQLQTMIIISNK